MSSSAAYTFRSNISIKSLLIGTSLLCACECYKVRSLRLACALCVHTFSYLFHFIHSAPYYIDWSANSAMQIFEYKCFGKSFHGNLRCNNGPHGSDTNQATKFSFAFICINEKQ